MKFKVPVYWTMYGVYEIEANSFAEAASMSEDMDLPVHGEYVSDSCTVATEMVDEENK